MLSEDEGDQTCGTLQYLAPEVVEKVPETAGGGDAGANDCAKQDEDDNSGGDFQDLD